MELIFNAGKGFVLDANGEVRLDAAIIKGSQLRAGAVACDRNLHLAAATPTGGSLMKRPGRVGDSLVIGAGLYADDDCHRLPR